MDKYIIEINQLSKYYGPRRGVEDISFTVKAGEIFGFIGQNGAGKTTTIRALLALIHPDSGNASIFGKDSMKEASSIAEDIGYLPAEAYYYKKMTVKELLEYSAALYKKDCSIRIKELTERLNLDTSRKISDLSYGNKKKVGIVAALLHSPKLIILDEPTSGIDPLVQQSFFDILKEENRKGAAVLFSSHVLSDVQKICSRVAVLKEGRVIHIQNISELRKNSYKKIHLIAEQKIPEGYFSDNGIADFKQKNCQASFIYHGKISEMIEKLDKLKVRDVLIEDPTLEEIFLHYYQ